MWKVTSAVLAEQLLRTDLRKEALPLADGLPMVRRRGVTVQPVLQVIGEEYSSVLSTCLKGDSPAPGPSVLFVAELGGGHCPGRSPWSGTSRPPFPSSCLGA